jgi:hypothetical protein
MTRTLSFMPTPVYKISQSFVSKYTGDCYVAVVACLHLMVLVLKMVTPPQSSWCVLHLVEKESVTAVQHAYCTQLHVEPPSRVSIYAW